MGTVTTGNHRFANVTARSQFGVLQEVVPGATVYVTVTSTGVAATIYSDPGMTIQITGALITADPSGFYEYYIPAGYNVTEQITAPSGLNVTLSNIVLNGSEPLVGSFTTTASASDVVALNGITASSHVSLTPTNSAAAAMIASVYVSSKSANSLTVTHTATAGATFDIIATAN